MKRHAEVRRRLKGAEPAARLLPEHEWWSRQTWAHFRYVVLDHLRQFGAHSLDELAGSPPEILGLQLSRASRLMRLAGDGWKFLATAVLPLGAFLGLKMEVNNWDWAFGAFALLVASIIAWAIVAIRRRAIGELVQQMERHSHRGGADSNPRSPRGL